MLSMSGCILLLPYMPMSCVQEQLVPCSVWLWGFFLRMRLLSELHLVHGISVWNITFLLPTPLCSRSFCVLNFSMGLLPEVKFQVFWGSVKHVNDACHWAGSSACWVCIMSSQSLENLFLTFQEISTPKLCQCLLSLQLYCFIPNFTKISCVLSELKTSHNFSLYATNIQPQATGNVHVTMHTKLKLYLLSTMFSLSPTCVEPKLLLCPSAVCHHLCEFLHTSSLYHKYRCVHQLCSTVCIVPLLSVRCWIVD
jgi:hypothetical protein